MMTMMTRRERNILYICIREIKWERKKNKQEKNPTTTIDRWINNKENVKKKED